ncbi:MAG: SH3 domain-containing protein [Planctomycetia bacterium]|nr:SH3 domain-containing protein [Planctomycetia bacterium]
MRLRPVMAVLVCFWLAAAARAEDNEEFPYRAYINADDVYVRSGPGQNYYPVLRLKRGDTVDVYRRDPGGWYAIRPPAECFSWISAEFVEPGEGRMAAVKGDRVVARVGSAFSDIRDVIQVRLDEGEQVEIIEARRIGTGPAAQTWYKILPPAGEFRWVSGQFLEDRPAKREVRRRDPSNNLLIAKHARQRDEEGEGDDEYRPRRREDFDEDFDEDARDLASVRRSATRRSDIERTSGEEERRPKKVSGTESRVEQPRSQSRADSVPDTFFARGDSGKRAAPRGDQQVLAELEAIDLELSTIVSREPATWDFRALHGRVDALLAHCESALDRGRVRLVQRKVARFEDIQNRHDQVASAQRTTDARNLDAQRASLGGSMGVRGPADGRYDGVGKLTQLYPAQTGVASYALLDRQGQVSHYVTPAPGVNLRQYLGREVGVQGTLGYMPDARTSHVTAKRVTVLEGGSLLR